MKIEKSARINLLDGFRFLAILLVILFHYLHRFSEVNGLYPYGTAYTDFTLAKFGHTGVQFFFIISGFVIFLTLEKSESLKEFVIKRFIRLFPMLLFCSLVTFTVVGLIDKNKDFPYFHKTALSFIPSLTFIEPDILRKLLGLNLNGFIDGVYWSLVIEVRFYLMVCILYFLDKKNFFENWLKFSVFIVLMYQVILINHSKFHFSDHLSLINAPFVTLFFPKYIIYFTLGMFFFLISSGRRIKRSYVFILGFYVLLEEILFLEGLERVFFLAFIGLFLIMLYKPNWLNLLATPLLAKIGLVSYPLYLLHQNIGVLSIHKLSAWINDKNGIISLLLVLTTIIAFSYLAHVYLDHPVQKHLKNFLLGKRKQPLPAKEEVKI
jgi:peptidoglycan/LPS O-acetylase OafA/YrhL